MNKKNNIINFSFTIILIFLPALLGFFLIMRSWIPTSSWISNQDWIYILIGIGYIFYSFIITFLFFKIKVISLESFQINIPLSLVLGTIFIFDEIIPIWGVAIISISMVFSTFLVIFFVEKYKESIKNKKIQINNGK